MTYLVKHRYKFTFRKSSVSDKVPYPSCTVAVNGLSWLEERRNLSWAVNFEKYVYWRDVLFRCTTLYRKASNYIKIKRILTTLGHEEPGIAQCYSAGLRGGWSGIRAPAGAGNFSLHHRVQISSVTHTASYPVCTTGSFPGGKASGEWNWPLTSM
jgi:hypothetical protein